MAAKTTPQPTEENGNWSCEIDSDESNWGSPHPGLKLSPEWGPVGATVKKPRRQLDAEQDKRVCSFVETTGKVYRLAAETGSAAAMWARQRRELDDHNGQS